MATTYTWDVQQVELASSANGFNKAITRATWQCTATSDNGNTKSQVGVIEFDTNALTTATFVPFEQMTKQQIIDLVTATVHFNVIQNALASPDYYVADFSNTATNTATIISSNIPGAVSTSTPSP